jgi:hypothetical protein
MSSTPPPKPFGDSLDFEITDFNEARRSLDELPAGLAQLQRLRDGDDWSAARRKLLPTDRALTGFAMDWVMALPPALRPHTACEQFPRVVNAIATSWTDRASSSRVLEHMIHDYRGGRRGFPRSVQAELCALLEHRSGSG